MPQKPASSRQNRQFTSLNTLFPPRVRCFPPRFGLFFSLFLPESGKKSGVLAVQSGILLLGLAPSCPTHRLIYGSVSGGSWLCPSTIQRFSAAIRTFRVSIGRKYGQFGQCRDLQDSQVGSTPLIIPLLLGSMERIVWSISVVRRLFRHTQRAKSLRSATFSPSTLPNDQGKRAITTART